MSALFVYGYRPLGRMAWLDSTGRSEDGHVMTHGSLLVSRLRIHPISAPTRKPCLIISDGGRLRLSYDSIPKLHFQGQSRDGTFDFYTWSRCFVLGLKELGISTSRPSQFAFSYGVRFLYSA
jgi:hypothetical protein